MTNDEFLSSIKSRGASFAPGATQRDIILATNALMAMQAARLPQYMSEIYTNAGGINLGSGYIFGPTEWKTNRKVPVPSIVNINNEIAKIQSMHGKTVFGRNDLFWFVFDTFGTCYMLDNVALRELRKYDNPYKAMTDCLVAGKF